MEKVKPASGAVTENGGVDALAYLEHEVDRYFLLRITPFSYFQIPVSEKDTFDACRELAERKRTELNEDRIVVIAYYSESVNEVGIWMSTEDLVDFGIGSDGYPSLSKTKK